MKRMPPSRSRRPGRWRTRSPAPRFVVLEKAAHLAALERPDEVNALIDEFLAVHS